MTSAKIFKWERKTDELGGVARGKESVLTSVLIDSNLEEKEKDQTDKRKNKNHSTHCLLFWVEMLLKPNQPQILVTK